MRCATARLRMPYSSSSAQTFRIPRRQTFRIPRRLAIESDSQTDRAARSRVCASRMCVCRVRARVLAQCVPEAQQPLTVQKGDGWKIRSFDLLIGRRGHPCFRIFPSSPSKHERLAELTLTLKTRLARPSPQHLTVLDFVSCCRWARIAMRQNMARATVPADSAAAAVQQADAR